ncbi:MAG: hypothetical protein Q7S45_03855 [Candidatus Curtissbacteria bacterium]|nr:hypothetical protein [Candidatus Curtissbacteria bacterium]
MKEKIVITLLVFSAAIIRFLLIARDSVPFAYDMGRDLLWAKDISFYHTPTLIGPAASIWGVYFQPFWYYFLSIPLLLTGGNPLSAVFATAAMVLLTGFLAFILFKNYLPKIYIFTLAVLLLFSSNLINISTFAFHANLLPLLTLLTTYFIFASIVKNPLNFSLAAFFVSLMFSADPAPAVAFTIVLVFFFFFLKLYKSREAIKTAVTSAVFYLIPFIPQIIFELRNNFIQTKSLFAYFSGNNPSLSGQLPLLGRIPNRLSVYFDFVKANFAPQNILTLTLIIFTIYGLYKFSKSISNRQSTINNALHTLFRINLYIFIITFLINTFLVNVEIKNWYLSGQAVNAAFLIVFALVGIRSKILTLLFLTIFLLANLLPVTSSHKIARAAADPATLSNQLKVIDTIYADKTDPFSVYVYTPSIYDLNYQHLFWWQGIKKGKGLPADFAYLPQEPDYVRNKSKYFVSLGSSNTIYLIIENAQENQFYTSADWQTNFNEYKIVWEKNINGAIRVQKKVKQN